MVPSTIQSLVGIVYWTISRSTTLKRWAGFDKAFNSSLCLVVVHATLIEDSGARVANLGLTKYSSVPKYCNLHCCYICSVDSNTLEADLCSVDSNTMEADLCSGISYTLEAGRSTWLNGGMGLGHAKLSSGKQCTLQRILGWWSGSKLLLDG